MFRKAPGGQPICRDYARTGYCRYGERCKFKHIDREKENVDDKSEGLIDTVVDAVMEKFAARVAKKRGTQRQASEADSDDEGRAKKVKLSDEDLYNMLIKG